MVELLGIGIGEERDNSRPLILAVVVSEFLTDVEKKKGSVLRSDGRKARLFCFCMQNARVVVLSVVGWFGVEVEVEEYRTDLSPAAVDDVRLRINFGAPFRRCGRSGGVTCGATY